jgi:hypothetical protein
MFAKSTNQICLSKEMRLARVRILPSVSHSDSLFLGPLVILADFMLSMISSPDVYYNSSLLESSRNFIIYVATIMLSGKRPIQGISDQTLHRLTLSVNKRKDFDLARFLCPERQQETLHQLGFP